MNDKSPDDLSLGLRQVKAMNRLAAKKWPGKIVIRVVHVFSIAAGYSI